METSIISKNAEETYSLGASFAEKVKQGGIICLYGDLGGGKTTFTQGLAHALGITKHVTSPTFLVIKTYELASGHTAPQGDFYHIDLYRLGSEQEIEDIGVVEVLENQRNIVVIEWSEKLGALLPKKRLDIHFDHLDENERKITIHDHR